YDHVPSPILAGVEGSFQYGFRVPLLFVSAYTSPRFISNRQLDFGSILRFVEYNFGLTVGGLGFADARAVDDLHEFYHLEDTPRTFIATPTRISIKDFIEDKTPPTDPDDD
ncbi:MAG: alkaline phosphatase family protein, partial [Candidatus Sulfotelmatobacter sp.]